MFFTVREHFLYRDGKRVEYRPSPNHGGVITPRLIVIHYTGTNGLASPLGWLCNPGSQVSAHLLIDTNGDIYQLLPFNLAGWHAGASCYEGRTGVNGFSVGIENVGVGGVWPAVQIEANRAVIAALFAAYPIEDVVGHSEVATPPGRKPDPGPYYPWSMVVESAPAAKIPPTSPLAPGGEIQRTIKLTSPYMRGPDVDQILKNLQDRGYYKGKLDGMYGPLAAAAVRQFQRDHGLQVDGEAGPLTVAAMRMK